LSIIGDSSGVFNSDYTVWRSKCGEGNDELIDQIHAHHFLLVLWELTNQATKLRFPQLVIDHEHHIRKILLGAVDVERSDARSREALDR
jgi:hypothetical protein